MFNKKKENKKLESDQKYWIEELDVDTNNWFQVYSACLGKMVTIQNACNELVVKGQQWNIDFADGSIAFGEQKYPLQFIGSEANSDNSWLWGWENINGLSKEIIQLAENTKKAGEKWNLESLTTANFELDDTFNGHNLSIVTCGIADKYCYFRAPHDEGAVLVAFSGLPENVFD